MQFLYTLIWLCLAPFVPFLWRHRQRKGKEDMARRGERFGIPSQPRPTMAVDGKLIWLHAASVGESLSLLAQIDELRRHYPSWRYLVTTGTVTSAKLMADRLPPEALHQYVPFDYPRWVARFLNHWQPDGVLWVESEIWPGLIGAVRARGIPAVLLNARMSEKSAQNWRFVSGWARYLLGTFSLVAAQTAADAARLRAFVSVPVLELGNLKFVSKPLPVDSEKQQLLRAQIANRPVWLMASTHAPEENIAAEVHVILKKDFPNILTIIAPRHPARGAAIAAALSSYDTVTRRSEGAPPAAIYIADTLGELGTLYDLVKPVVIGGSFTVGGHNPIEPAQLGCAIICGPLMYNFTAIVATFDAADALLHAADAGAIATHIKTLLQDDARRIRLGGKAQQVCAAESESLPRLWQAMAPWRDAVAARSYNKVAA